MSTSTSTHAGERTGRLDRERVPTASLESERLPSGLTLFLGLMVSLAAVIAVTFWLAAQLHAPGTPVHGAPEPAAAATE